MVGCYLCPGCGLVSFGTPGCLCPGCGRGVVCFSLAQGMGVSLFGWFVCWLVCGVWLLVCISSARGVGVTLLGWVYNTCMWGLVLVCISSARGVGLVYLVGLPVGIWWFCIGLMPLSYVYRGGVVRLLFSLVASTLYYSYLFVGLCPFGNKFLIIQKKKKNPGS